MTAYTVRCIVIATLVVTGGQFGTAAPVAVPLVASLDTLPVRLGDWQGVNQPPFDPETLRVLGADDYLNRLYWQPDGRVVNLYIAYYSAQQGGDGIHSPQHCLPGNGWQPVSHVRVSLGGERQLAEINRYVVARHDARQIVYYWFEGRGRIVASEYLNKWFLLVDGMRRGRTEGALVRLATPLPPGGATAERAADDMLLTLGRDVHAKLARVLP